MTTKTNNVLTNLPNIGKTLSERLIEIGIETVEDLKITGSENTFIRLLTVDEHSCINELFAIEGAIQGIRWHYLDDDKKEELRMFYNMCKVQKTKNNLNIKYRK